MNVKMAMGPKLPSVEEVRDHQPTHQPFRNCCRYCAMVEADDARHPISGSKIQYPVILMDYTYLSKLIEKGSPILVVHDDDTQCIMTFAAPSKGAWMTVAHRIGHWTNGL